MLATIYMLSLRRSEPAAPIPTCSAPSWDPAGASTQSCDSTAQCSVVNARAIIAKACVCPVTIRWPGIDTNAAKC